MGSSEKDIRNTFPIPPGAVSSRKWKLALGSPITWAPFLPAVGAYAFLDAPFAAVAGAIVVITGGLAWYWKGKGKALEKKILEELITESNDEQDRELATQARALHDTGFNAYGVTLMRFLKLKNEIETAMHTSGEITEAKQQVERLVDTLCFTVADEIQRLVQIEQRVKRADVPISVDRKEAMFKTHSDVGDQIQKAYDTLSETRMNLDDILNPVDDTITGSSNLNDVIGRLKEESEIAKRVRERIQTDAYGDLGSGTTTYGDASHETE